MRDAAEGYRKVTGRLQEGYRKVCVHLADPSAMLHRHAAVLQGVTKTGSIWPSPMVDGVDRSHKESRVGVGCER